MKACVCALEINKSFREAEREFEAWKNMVKAGKTEEKLKREKEEAVNVN